MFKRFFRCVGVTLLGLASFVSTQSVFAMKPKPEVIYGTWQTGKKTQECVICALKSGIRCIDTARMYNNEKQVGLAVNEFISESDFVCREDIKIITKLLPNDIQEYSKKNKVSISVTTQLFFEESLRNLNTEYIDVVLIHDTDADLENITEIYKALLELKGKGRVKHVGVSNCTLSILEQLSPIPDVVQNPFFPGILGQELLEDCGVPSLKSYEYCCKKSILYQGYKSLGHGRLIGKDDITVDDCLKYALQCGVSPVFSSTNVAHIRQVGEAIQKGVLDESPFLKNKMDQLNSCLSLQAVYEIICAGL